MDSISQQQDTVSNRPWAMVAGLAVTLIFFAALGLWHLRQEIIDSQAQALRLLSTALTDELDRGLLGAEEGLRALQLELRDGRLPLTGAEAVRSLKTRADLMPLVRTLWLVDERGHVLSCSDATPVPTGDTFSPALNDLGGATAVSRPFLDPVTKTSFVALAIRVTGSTGTSGVWMLAGIPANLLLGAFSVASPASDARMAVYRNDGARLVGAIIANPALDEPHLAKVLSTLRDSELRRFRDGSEHLVSVRDLPHNGLKVVLTRDLQVMLMSWREAARWTATGMVILLSALLIATHRMQRSDQRHKAAQRALRDQQVRASKLESLGGLAGGVAHDFNNVLAAIVGYGEMAQDAAEPDSHQYRQLDRVLQAAQRGKALVERILSFSRGGGRSSVVFELQPIVEEVLALLAGSLRHGVVLERELDAQGAALKGDPTQIFEAVMNLCTNAMQAMPDGGMVSVRMRRREVRARLVLSHTQVDPGSYIELTISDQGTGIAPEVMEHLFEPFFTTKGAQSGTGLGLAVVHGVVAELHGAIDVQSRPGHGASFSLFLPESHAGLDAMAEPSDATPEGRGQAILVVDDEPTLVDMAVEILEGLGYKPTGFSDSVEALRALQDDPQRFAAVITDEVMPNMSGTQFTESLRAFASAMPVVLVSGYGGAMLADRALRAGVTRVLTKPLQRAELARVLADLLH